METSSILKHFLCDDDSLSSYFEGKLVSMDDVKRRMLLLERSGNRFIPDHYYRLSQIKSFDGIDSLSGVLIIGLLRIAEEHLELRKNRIHVKQEKQNDWQVLITRIPPLVLQAVFLHKNKSITDQSTSAIQEYFRDVILPNVRYTALPYPYIPQLENYIERGSGLHDLHMHLNGSTETDITWQDFLKAPDKIYKELKDGFINGLVKEQFEQESHLIDPIKFRNLLLIARRIRNYIFYMLYPGVVSTSKANDPKTPRQLLSKLLDINTSFYDGLGNPFSDLVGDKRTTDAFSQLLMPDI